MNNIHAHKHKDIYKKLFATSKDRRRKKAVQCMLCEEDFLDTFSYEDHMINFHNKIDYPHLYKCEHCPRRFKFKHHMNLHLRKHKGSSRFSCEHCQERFVTKENRRRHLRQAHIQSNIYQCCKCTNVSQSQLSLNSHMENVHGIDPKTHNNCNKCFALCEYKSSAFVIPAQKHIGNFSDLILENNELSKMIEARQCGDIVKQPYGHREVQIENVSPVIKKHDVRTVRRSVKKFFYSLRNAQMSMKHTENEVIAKGSTIQGYKEGSSRGIVIDSVVSLSNNVPNMFDRNIVIKLERIDQTPYIDREYVVDSTDDRNSIKSEPIDSKITSPYNLDVPNIDILNSLNPCLWPKPDDFLPQNLLVNITHEKDHFENFNILKSSFPPEKTNHGTSSNELYDLESREEDSVSIYQCRYCTSKFMTKSSLAEHVNNNHFSLVLMYKCKKCDRIFNSKSMLIKHMTETHNPKKLSMKHKCMFCVETFRLRIQLNQHVRKYHKNVIKCCKCKSLFNDFVSLKRHMKFQHNHRLLFRCDICDAIFLNKNLLKQHKSVNKHLLKCSKCNGCFKRSSIVRLLKVNSDNNVFRKCKVCKLVSKIEMCVKQSNSFKNVHKKRKKFSQNISKPPEGKSVHLNTQSPIPRGYSTVTNIKEYYPESLVTPARECRDEKNSVEPSSENRGLDVYICQSCESLYSSNDNFYEKLQQNIELRMGSKGSYLNGVNFSPQICIICDATLHIGLDHCNRVMNLNKPIDVRMFECILCNQLFAIWTKWIDHMRLNHKQYLPSNQCVDYDGILEDPDTLENHRQRKLSHNQPDPSETSSLKKVDPQMCIITINVAPREDNVIDFSKLLKCDHCSALFQLKSSLQSHIQLEHMPKVTLHKCCLCSTVFYRITDFDRHLRNKHQLDMELHSGNADPTNFNLKWKKILTHTYEIEKM